MDTKRKQYPDLYSWSHPLGNHVLAHQDGAVSAYIDWAGFDFEMLSEAERLGLSADLLAALNTIESGYCAEFHFWREWDASLAETYRTQEIKRGGAFAQAIRDAQAKHLSIYGMSNCLVSDSSGVSYKALQEADLWAIYTTLTPRQRLELEKKYKTLKRRSLS